MIVGIVGSEGAKFTLETEAQAKAIIREILTKDGVTGYSSGHCHLGGIDIWTEEIGENLHYPAIMEIKLLPFIFPPKNFTWATGFKPRNIQIAKASDELHCITV